MCIVCVCVTHSQTIFSRQFSIAKNRKKVFVFRKRVALQSQAPKQQPATMGARAHKKKLDCHKQQVTMHIVQTIWQLKIIFSFIAMKRCLRFFFGCFATFASFSVSICEIPNWIYINKSIRQREREREKSCICFMDTFVRRIWNGDCLCILRVVYVVVVVVRFDAFCYNFQPYRSL